MQAFSGVTFIHFTFKFTVFSQRRLHLMKHNKNVLTIIQGNVKIDLTKQQSDLSTYLIYNSYLLQNPCLMKLMSSVHIEPNKSN